MSLDSKASNLYISSRGSAPILDFREVALTGLADDGGLYIPQTLPQFSPEDIAALAGLDYVETAVRVMLPFVSGSLSEEELRKLCRLAYGNFAHAAITPLSQLDSRHWLLELFHGPTLAFKDVALQLLGQIFEHFLSGGDKSVTIIGATSGDTGSAAIEAVAGREHMSIFMLYPQGRISDVQRRQMTTIDAPNVHVVALDGSFDDAQAMVKHLFADKDMRAKLNLSAVNSINWARLMAQIVYYFYAAVRLGAPQRAIAFSVPTGNFGDVYAGYLAARMGLPIERLIVATNVNDILYRAFSKGDYSLGKVTPTATPSMDIQVSSNFERLLFDWSGHDGAEITQMMSTFAAQKAIAIPQSWRARSSNIFSAARVDGAEMQAALRWAYEHGGQVIDPHSAVALSAARAQAASLPKDVPIVTLATAHPAKFPEAIEQAIGLSPALPRRLEGLFDRAEKHTPLPNDADVVKSFIYDAL